MININSLSVQYVEDLLQQYLRDPKSVEPAWRDYFAATVPAESNGGFRSGPSFVPAGLFNSIKPPCDGNGAAASAADSSAAQRIVDRAERVIDAFRTRGHLAAAIDPLGRPRPGHAELTPQHHGFSEGDLQRVFAPTMLAGREVTSLGHLFEHLQQTYAGPVGVEYMHLDDLDARNWLESRMEPSQNRTSLTAEAEVRVLSRLTEASLFEDFVLRKYVGTKTFSLEGSETLIPVLDLAIERAAAQGVTQIVMGMAHRGRLNVLANILGKSARQIFCEFDDRNPALPEGGDVKYHLGHSNDRLTAAGRKVHLTLCFNPSHLEFVNPVALGSLRAKQDRAGDIDHVGSMGILVHGDAAMAGEGVVQETLNLSQLAGYTTGGTLHLVINNQIGFTTLPGESRSTTYATDVAKMLQSPIFHVNAEDVDAVAHVLDIAMDFRHRFHRDVFIDMYCYRRRGHNESDEPEFTQPLLYGEIRKRKPIRERYLEQLVGKGTLTLAQGEELADRYRQHLEEEYSSAKCGNVAGPTFELSDVWRGYRAGREAGDEVLDTGAERERLVWLLRRLIELPAGFEVHPKLKRWLERRREMAEGNRQLDWAAAEALALGSLALDGYRVRLTGQDSARGTFSHRHAVLHDIVNGNTFFPLGHLGVDQAPVEIINSPLSEAGALGFEYGYSMDYPDGLVAWEAQFGDFWNVAQVIVDQFLASAEEKWRRLSGITLLLPHGFEGQGPEHSSARIERFLRMSVKDNIQVVVPTTPAQYFHVLRRQMLRRWLKPLVVIAPKSLLRHPLVVSDLDECASGRFHRVIPDAEVDGSRPVDRILLASGKVYYDLYERRQQLKRDDVAIVRVEQLYPFPEQQLRAALESYPEGTPAVWVQEEPENMGACHFVRNLFRGCLIDRFPLYEVARRAAASPATGSASIHRREQEDVLTRAFGELIETDWRGCSRPEAASA